MPTRALRITGADMPVIASREAAIEACSAIETTMESLLQLIEAESVLLRAGKTLAAAALVQRENEFAAAYIDDLRLLREIGPDLEQFAPTPSTASAACMRNSSPCCRSTWPRLPRRAPPPSTRSCRRVGRRTAPRYPMPG